MTLEELKQEIRQQSLKENTLLKERGEREAAAIKQKAEEEAADLQREQLENARRAVQAKRNKLMYAATAAYRTALNREKEQIYDEIFEEAKKGLDQFRDSGEYQTVFKKLLSETIEEAGGGSIILHVDPKDEELCRQCIEDAGFECEIRADLECTGGLHASTEEGQVKVHNTFESRLERARDVHRLEIFRKLW